MRSLRLIHLVARRAALVAGVVGTAATVACSDATAPRPVTALIPTSGAEATIVPLRSLVTVRVTTYFGQLIVEKPSVRFYAAGDSATVKDNSAFDKDTTLGIITVSAPTSALMKVCLVGNTENFSFSPNAACNTVAGNTTKVNAGTLIMHVFPGVGLRMLNKSGNVIPGGTFTLTGPPGSGYSLTVSDGDANDRYVGVDGNSVVWVPAPGTYKWCETKAPMGYLIALPECGKVDLIWDFGIQVDITHSLNLYGLPF
jgi:hypothetical protein